MTIFGTLGMYNRKSRLADFRRKGAFMILALGVIIFVIGCCLSSYEDNSYNAERRAEQRHRELMRALDEASRQPHPPAQRRVKQVRRRFAQDKNGNILGEEISEEELEE